MLVLSRKPGESIHLFLPDGRRVRVTWVPRRYNPGEISLGVEAPRDVRVTRGELRDAAAPQGEE